jgi:hypothetical protein
VSSKASPTEPSKEEGSKSPARPIPIEIQLEHGRGRHLGWVLFGVVAGSLFLLKLGFIGQFLGAALIFIALLQGAEAIRTFLHAPGTFRVTDETIELPTRLCSGKQLTLSSEQLQHAFFLRRSVPWTQAGPILVVEAEDKAYSFPRDWFASDSDQRRVAMALNHRLSSTAE